PILAMWGVAPLKALSLVVLLALVLSAFAPWPSVHAASSGLAGTLGPLPDFCPAMSVDPSHPKGLTGDGAAYVNGVSYTFGGRLADGTYFDGVLAYDHASQTSRKVATLPVITGSSDLCYHQP